MKPVITMDSSTRCSRSSPLEQAFLWCLAALLWLACGLAHAQTAAEVAQLRVERAEDAIQVSAQLQFEVPPAVEEALLKGIPMVFVAEADVLRERWYWYDKKVAIAQRSMRLAYQPLTRRWRLNIHAGSGQGAPVGLALNQSLDTLAQALAVIKRISQWKIADASELDTSLKYRVEFRFRLDMSQLPRPFQIGAIGQSDWDIGCAAIAPLSLEPGK
jgi:hypothetical protein